MGRSGARLGTRPLGRPFGRLVIASMVVFAAVVVLGGCNARNRGSASQSWSGVAVEDGSAFVGTKDGRVIQITLRDGEGDRTFAQVGATFGPPEVDGTPSDPAFYGTPTLDDGRLYVGSYHGVVYAMRADGVGDSVAVREFEIDPTGTSLAEGIAGSVVPSDGALVVAASVDAEEGRLYVLDAPGLTERCRYPQTDTVGQLWTTPTVVEGIAYFGDLSHRLHAVSIADCRLVWQAPAELGGAIVAPPVVVGNKLYVGAFDRVFYEVDLATGAVIELFTAGGWFWAGAATDGVRVFAPSLDGMLYAYNVRDRQRVWTYDQEGQPEPILSAPVVVGDKVVMASDSGTVTLLSATQGGGGLAGSRLDTKLVKGGEVRAPLTVRDDVVYVHSLGEFITALRVDGTRLVPVWEVNVSR